MPRIGCLDLHGVNPNFFFKEKGRVFSCTKNGPLKKMIENSKFIYNKQENTVTCMSLDPFWECETLSGESDKKPSLYNIGYIKSIK